MNNHTITIKDEKLLKVGEYKVVGRKVVFKTRDLWGFLDKHIGFPIGFLFTSVVLSFFGELELSTKISDVLALTWIIYVYFGSFKRTEIVGTLKKVITSKPADL